MWRIISVLLLLPAMCFSQTTIKGQVYAAEGGIPGATVILLNTSHGTATQANGSFVMTNIPP